MGHSIRIDDHPRKCKRRCLHSTAGRIGSFEQGEEQYAGYRIKIFKSSALEAGNISISWSPAAGSPVFHNIKVYRADQVIDVLKTTFFEILRRGNQLEAARLDGILTAVLRVPDLRVGDELEVSYTTRINDPTLGNDDAGTPFN